MKESYQFEVEDSLEIVSQRLADMTEVVNRDVEQSYGYQYGQHQAVKMCYELISEHEFILSEDFGIKGFKHLNCRITISSNYPGVTRVDTQFTKGFRWLKFLLNSGLILFLTVVVFLVQLKFSPKIDGINSFNPLAFFLFILPMFPLAKYFERHYTANAFMRKIRSTVFKESQGE